MNFSFGSNGRTPTPDEWLTFSESSREKSRNLGFRLAQFSNRICEMWKVTEKKILWCEKREIIQNLVLRERISVKSRWDGREQSLIFYHYCKRLQVQWTTHRQCGKYRIFLLLRFYVKSILVNHVKNVKMAVIDISITLRLISR